MRNKQILPRKKLEKRRYRSDYSPELMLKAYREVIETGRPVKTTARKYGIPMQTLWDRVSGKVANPENCSPGANMLLSMEKEQELVDHVLTLLESGQECNNKQIQHLGGELSFKLGHKKTQKPLSNNWLYGFLKRWKHKLPSRKVKLESIKAKKVLTEQISSYNDNLNEILEKHDLKDKPQQLEETELPPEKHDLEDKPQQLEETVLQPEKHDLKDQPQQLEETVLQPETKPHNNIAAPNSELKTIVSQIKVKTKPIRPRQKLEKRKYSPEVMLKAYNEVIETGRPVKTTARKYGIPMQTLWDRVSGKVNPENCLRGPNLLLSSEEEQKLVEHVLSLLESGKECNSIQLRQLGGELSFKLGHKETPKALSINWLYGFLKRWNLKLSSLKVKPKRLESSTVKPKRLESSTVQPKSLESSTVQPKSLESSTVQPKSLESPSAESALPEHISSYYDHLNEILEKYDLKDKPQHIFKLDEIVLQPYHKPNKVIAAPKSKKKSKYSQKTQKAQKSTTITLIGCANAIGKSLPPYFVFKGKRLDPDLMKGASAGARAGLSDSGWCSSTMFQKYLEEHFLPYARFSTDASQPLLLLYDGSSSHFTSLIEWAKEKHLLLFVLPPHTNQLLKPLDMGVYVGFKSYFNRECSLYMKRNKSDEVSKNNLCELACNAYMKFVSTANIQTAFSKTGVHPFCKQNIPAERLEPAEAIKEEDQQQPVRKVTIRLGIEEVNRFLLDKSEKETKTSEEMSTDEINTEEINTDNINTDEINTDEINTDETSTTVPRPCAGQSTMTEEQCHLQLIQYYEQDESPKSQENNSTSPHKNTKSNKRRKTSSSPKPSISELESENLADSSQTSDTMEDNSTSETCCVCKSLSPMALNDCSYYVNVKWVQCDKPGCTHWAHVKFCTKESVIRRHSTFLCPHCVE